MADEFKGDEFKNLNKLLAESKELAKSILNSKQEIKKIDEFYSKSLIEQGELMAKLREGHKYWFTSLKSISKIQKTITENYKTYRDTNRSLRRERKMLEKLDEKIQKGEYSHNKKMEAMYKKQVEERRIQVAMSQDQNDMFLKTIPIIGKLGTNFAKYILGPFSAVYDIVKNVLGIFLKIGGAVLGKLTDLMGKVFDQALAIERAAGGISANLGMSQQNSGKLLMNMNNLTLAAMQYGGGMEDVVNIYEGFADATGRIQMFDEKDIANMTRLGLATGIGTKGAAEMAASFDLVGTSLDRSVTFMNESISMSAKLGLNATKLLKGTQSLIEDFKGFNFQQGLDDMTQMVAKAQSLRFDLGSMKSLADNMFNLENAVEASARLRVLGGNFAAMADPLSMMFDAMNDPNALMNKTLDSLKGLAEQNEDGFFYIPPAQRGILRDVADALGQDVGELTDAAIKQAEIADKISKAGAGFMSEEDRIALANMITMGKNGYEIDGKSLSTLRGNANVLKQMVEANKTNEEAAQKRLDFMQRLRRLGDMFINGLTPIITSLSNILTDGNNSPMAQLENAVKTASEKIGNIIKSVMTGENMFVKLASQAVNFIGDISDKFAEFFSGVTSDNFGDKMKELFVKGIKTMVDEVGPYIKGAFAEMWNATLGDTWLIGDMETGEKWDNLMTQMNNPKQENDFIYSQNDGFRSFNKDDLIIGGTGLMSQSQTPTQTTVSGTQDLNINVSGTLRIESDGQSVSLSPDDLKQAGIMALARAVRLELHKMDRGTYKDDSNTAFKPL